MPKTCQVVVLPIILFGVFKNNRMMISALARHHLPGHGLAAIRISSDSKEKCRRGCPLYLANLPFAKFCEALNLVGMAIAFRGLVPAAQDPATAMAAAIQNRNAACLSSVGAHSSISAFSTSYKKRNCFAARLEVTVFLS